MFVDTNVMLRWILDDHETLSARARTVIGQADAGDLLLTDVILGEMYYVLRGKGLANREVGTIFEELLQQAVFRFDNEAWLTGQIKVIAGTNLDFADCYLISRAVQASQPLTTFDKPMQKTYEKYKLAKLF